MVTVEELEQKLLAGNETRAFEVKGPGLRSDSAFRAKIARAVMAMGNLRGGGQVCIGIDADQIAQMEPGLDPTELAEWSNFDDVAQELARYSDPPVAFTVHAVTVRSHRTLVVLDVQEFDDVPHICQRSYDDVLRSGAIYVRPRGKPQSLAVATHVAMRELVDLAVVKRHLMLNGSESPGGAGTAASARPAPPQTMTRSFPRFGLEETYRGWLPGRFCDADPERAGLHLRAVWVPWWCENSPDRLSSPRQLEALVPESLMEGWTSYYSQHGGAGGLRPAAPVPDLVNRSSIVVDRVVARSSTAAPDLSARVGIALTDDRRAPRFLADLVLGTPDGKLPLAPVLQSLKSLAGVVTVDLPTWFASKYDGALAAGGTLELHAQGLVPDSAPSARGNLDQIVDLSPFGERYGSSRVVVCDAYYLHRPEEPALLRAITRAFTDAAIDWGYHDAPDDIDVGLMNLFT